MVQAFGMPLLSSWVVYIPNANQVFTYLGTIPGDVHIKIINMEERL